MVRHLVFWKWKEEVSAQDAQRLTLELKEKFHALLGAVDGLVEIDFGQNKAPGGYDIALCCLLSSWQALEGYQTHPNHLAIKSVIVENTCGRSCSDYEF